MKILGVIPARGGSKRLPGKNIRDLGGRPLLIWTVEVCKDIPEICDILVSTDDEKIANIARDAGALLPWLRPEFLATDEATSKDVALHALNWYQKQVGAVDGLMLLQPTSPFRTVETIRRGIDLFSKHGFRPVVGVSHTTQHPMWSLKRSGIGLEPFLPNGGLHLRSQELPEAFIVNGAFYLINPSDLSRLESFYSDDMIPLIIDNPFEAVDIDNEFDWCVAESICNKFAKSKNIEN